MYVHFQRLAILYIFKFICTLEKEKKDVAISGIAAPAEKEDATPPLTPAEAALATSWALANTLANSPPRFFLVFFSKYPTPYVSTRPRPLAGGLARAGAEVRAGRCGAEVRAGRCGAEVRAGARVFNIPPPLVAPFPFGGPGARRGPSLQTVSLKP